MNAKLFNSLISACSHTLTRSHTRSHSHTHTHARTHARTHTHTHLFCSIHQTQLSLIPFHSSNSIAFLQLHTREKWLNEALVVKVRVSWIGCHFQPLFPFPHLSLSIPSVWFHPFLPSSHHSLSLSLSLSLSPPAFCSCLLLPFYFIPRLTPFHLCFPTIHAILPSYSYTVFYVKLFPSQERILTRLSREESNGWDFPSIFLS